MTKMTEMTENDKKWQKNDKKWQKWQRAIPETWDHWDTAYISDKWEQQSDLFLSHNQDLPYQPAHIVTCAIFYATFN